MHRKPPSKPRSISILLFVVVVSMASLLVILSLLLQFPPTTSLPAPADPTTLVTQACRASLFPSLCASSILSSSSSSSLSPESLPLSLLSLSSQRLSRALSLSRSLLPSPSPSLSNAARNCIDHLTLSSLRLNSTPPSLPTHIALTSAALLYQYDCWSALKYVNTTRAVADVMSFVLTLSHITSSALSLIHALHRFGPHDLSLWSPPQTERDGYFPPHLSDPSADPQFPPDLSPDATVCNGCQYGTIQDAVNAAPDFGPGRFVIRIPTGKYEENVNVPFEKTNVVFVGDGMGRTVITGSLNAQMKGVTTYNTATVGVFGDGFMARDLTFENTAGPGSHQAVAFRCDADRAFLYSVEFLGHQDTLYARSMRQLYLNCTIAGTVDFIFGNSAAVFERCLILVLPRQESPEKGESDAVTAHGRTDPGQATGFVFKECTVNGSEEYVEIYRRRPTRHKVYLGRPWKQYSRTVFLNCYLGEMVRPEGWMPFRGELGLGTLFYGEYGSLGPGANVSGRVGWSSQVPKEHLGMYSVRNFLQGDEWVLKNQWGSLQWFTCMYFQLRLMLAEKDVSAMLLLWLDYAALGAPPDPDEVEESGRLSRMHIPHTDDRAKRLSFPPSIRDVVIGSGEIVVDDVRYTVSHVEPVERGLAKINITFHHISENVKRHEKRTRKAKDDSYFIPMQLWSEEFSGVHDSHPEGSYIDSGLTRKRHHQPHRDLDASSSGRSSFEFNGSRWA